MSDSDLLAATNMAEISYRHHGVSYGDDLTVPFATARKQEQEILISDLVKPKRSKCNKAKQKVSNSANKKNQRNCAVHVMYDCTVQPKSFGVHVGYAKVSPGTCVVNRGDVNGLQVYRFTGTSSIIK